jgi:hypothetical protein
MQGTDLQAIKLDRRPGDGKTVRATGVGGTPYPPMGFLGSGLKLIPSTCATTCATKGRTARAHARHNSTRTAMRHSCLIIRAHYTPISRDCYPSMPPLGAESGC